MTPREDTYVFHTTLFIGTLINHRKTNCEKAWQDALERCREILGEEDYALIEDFESPEKLMAAVKNLEDKYAKSAIPRLLHGIKPQLAKLQIFTTTLLLGIGMSNVSVAVLWGTTSLMIQVCSQSGL